MLANWQNVFRAINLATGMHVLTRGELTVVKLANLGGSEGEEEEERTLPEMLVRIPVTTSEDQDKSL